MIAKVMKSKMANIIPIIIEPILEACETKLAVEMEGEGEGKD